MTIAHGPALTAAGFAATTVSFGPARMGFGLFVPEFRTAFSMSTSSVGLVSSIGFSGFLVGLVLAQVLLGRRGPAAPVQVGLMAASIGMGLVALAPGVVVLAVGVFLAGSSAGLTWSPFNAAVHRKLPDADRPGALSRISTGTSVGVALAGVAAFGIAQTGWSWRASWVLFAVAGLLALMVNRAALRTAGTARDAKQSARTCRGLIGMRALSLFGVAFVMGAVSAIYIAFGADRLTQAGGVAGLPSSATPALVFLIYGLFGLAGLGTGRLRRIIGLPPLVRGALLAGALSAAVVALLPGTWGGLVVSAGLQGVHVMVTSAIIAFWSERLYPARPSLGFTVALLAVAAGNVLGPAAAGLASDAFGVAAMFLASATLAFLAAVLLRPRNLVDRP